MRIFHGTRNIAGIPGYLSMAEKSLGLDSRAICYPSNFMVGVDEAITGGALDLLRDCIGRFDVFNLNFGHSFLGASLRDVPLLKRLGKKVIMHFHGCDIRDSKLTLQQHTVSVCAECWPMACNVNRKEAHRMVNDYADAATVSTPDLLEFVPKAILLPQAIDLQTTIATAQAHARRQQERDHSLIRIVHTPSAMALKGTRFIEAVIAELKQQAAPVELVMLTGAAHDEVLGAILDGDIFVDQLLMGAYGVSAIEAMALGKPTICYLREDLIASYPAEPPIINANVTNLRDRILQLIAQRTEWDEIGCRSQDYVRQFHDNVVVAKRLAMLY